MNDLVAVYYATERWKWMVFIIPFLLTTVFVVASGAHAAYRYWKEEAFTNAFDEEKEVAV